MGLNSQTDVTAPIKGKNFDHTSKAMVGVEELGTELADPETLNITFKPAQLAHAELKIKVRNSGKGGEVSDEVVLKIE